MRSKAFVEEGMGMKTPSTDTVSRLTMRGMKTKKGMLLLVLLAVWCFLTLVTEGASGAVSRGSEDGEEALQQPHIVLILADDLGWNDIPWNNEEVYAPNLESLAREGVILQESYVQPLCTPSRSALLSGRYPFTIGRQHFVILHEQPAGLDLSLTLLPQSLKAAGYETHIVGKWHLGFCSWAYTPTQRGFDTYYGFYNSDEDYYHHTTETVFNATETVFKEEGQHDSLSDKAFQTTRYNPRTIDCAVPTDKEEWRSYVDLHNNTTPDTSKYGIYSTHVFASQVEQLLVTRDPEVPMFLYLPFQSVHAPLQVPTLYKTPYAHITDEDRKTYLGMVTAMDEAVGRVVTSLKDTGHYNNTVIVFTTDNGGPTACGANNWPLRGNKSAIWEGGTRGPAFIHSPFLPNARTTNPTLIHITDWLPTLVGLAGGVVPDGIDGVDQWKALTGVAPSARTNMVYNIDNETEFSAGIRMGKYKLLVGDPGYDEWTPPPECTAEAPHDDDFDDGKEENEERQDEKDEEIVMVSDFTGGVYHLLKEMTGRNDSEIQLYDLESDPEERNNVAAAHPAVVDVMVQMLYSQMSRFTPADNPDLVPEANPSNFGGVWSPGWC